MATSCGLPGCPSKPKLSNKGSKEEGGKGRTESRFKGPCGLPDCRNEAAAGSRPRPKLCDVPGCRDLDARKEGNDVLCLYRGPRGNNRKSAFFARAGAAYQLCVETWTKIRSDTYYWSLFKSIVFFVLGLKLFHDMSLPKGSKCTKRKKD